MELVQVKQLAPGQQHLNQIDYCSTRFDARIPIGVTAKDLLSPDFWAHHAQELKPRDEIRAWSEDGSWIAYYLVLDNSRTWAKLQLLQEYSLSQAMGSSEELAKFMESHEIKYRGAAGWSVIRKADGAVLQERMTDKNTAIVWLEQNARTQTGVPTMAKAA